MPDTIQEIAQYQLEHVSLANAGESIVSEWGAFRRHNGSDSWMQDPEWLMGYFDDQLSNLFVYSIYQSDRMCGLAPFLRRDWPLKWYLGEMALATFPLTRLRLLGDTFAFPLDEAAHDSLFSDLANSEISFHTLYLDGIPLDSFLWKYLHNSELIRKLFLIYEPEVPSPHPILRVEGSFEQYMGKYSSKHRKNLTREVKKLREGALGSMRLARFELPEEVPVFMEHAVELSRKTYQWTLHQRGLSLTDLVTKRLLFAAKLGSLRSYVLFCGERACAFLVGYQREGRFLLDEIGHDPALAKYSVGTVLQLLTVEDLFAYNRPKLFDLGEYGTYKAMLSTESYLQGKIYLFRRGAYSHFLRAGDQCCHRITKDVSSLLDRFNMKSKVKQALRGWNSPH